MNLVHAINPDTAMMPVAIDLYDNGYWKFCADDPMADDPTYDEFDLGPDYVIPAGTTVKIEGLWGWDRGHNMTPPTDWCLTLPAARTVAQTVAIILWHYNQEVAYGRFYFIEQVSQLEDGTIEIATGT